MQMRRPWWISRCEKLIQSDFGSSSIRSRSICSGFVLSVKPRRCVIRLTWVSTTTPLGMPNAVPKHHVGRFAADAGKMHEIVQRTWDFAVVVCDDTLRHADQVVRLGPEEPGGTDDFLQFARLGLRQVLHGGISAK